MDVLLDGKKVRAEAGETILQAARRAGIRIPTLCHHDGVSPYGACRVCLVEVKEGRMKGLQTSCTYPVEEGLVVETASPRVLKARRLVLELLLARSPDSEKVRELARETGLETSRFDVEEKSDCVLCGLCVRVCEEAIGSSAISFVGKGPAREVETPFRKASEECLGCLACLSVCPTGHIRFQDETSLRKIETWHTELEMARCSRCGAPVAPLPQMEALKSRIEVIPEASRLCTRCKSELLRSSLIDTKTIVGR